MKNIEQIPLLGVDMPYVPAGSLQIDNFPQAKREHIPFLTDSFGARGHLEGSNGEIVFSISYDQVEDDPRSEAFFKLVESDRDYFRRLTALSVRSKTGETVDLLDLPDGWRSYFSVKPEQTNQLSVASSAHKSTVLRDLRILTPAGLLTHAHEVGHAWTTDFPREYVVRDAFNGRKRSLSPAEADQLLTNEANAWAYAFNIFTPLISSDPSATFYIGDLARYAYGLCLDSYERVIEDLHLLDASE